MSIITQIMFYVFASLGLFAASMVVVSKNPVRAALFLVLTFISSAALWLLLKVEFLAFLLILIYVGAVMVLFLFVILMLDINEINTEKQTAKNKIKDCINFFLPRLCVASALLFILIYGLNIGDLAVKQIVMPEAATVVASDVELIGELLFTKYLFHFELVGILLLVAIVAITGLTFRGAQQRRSQIIHKQVQVKKEDRLTIVKMVRGEDVGNC